MRKKLRNSVFYGISRLARVTEIPQEGILDTDVTELIGDREVRISGCESVLVYETDCVVLRVRGGRRTIRGEGLEMERLTRKQVVLHGRIRAVETE